VAGSLVGTSNVRPLVRPKFISEIISSAPLILVDLPTPPS
jgi:hypothetical protein